MRMSNIGTLLGESKAFTPNHTCETFNARDLLASHIKMTVAHVRARIIYNYLETYFTKEI